VPPRKVQHVVLAKCPPLCTAQPFLIQKLNNLGDWVQRRQSTDALEHPIVCARRPGTDFDSFDLPAADRAGSPGLRPSRAE